VAAWHTLFVGSESQCQRNQGTGRTGLLGKAGRVRHAGTARTLLPMACQDSEQWRAGADAGRWLVVFWLWLLLAVADVVVLKAWSSPTGASSCMQCPHGTPRGQERKMGVTMRQVVEARSVHRCATVDNEKHVHTENTGHHYLYCVLVATIACPVCCPGSQRSSPPF
jgi:hypothetical protein